jgi:hypothetical protein
MITIDKRIAQEKQVVRHLIRTAKQHGFAVTKVYDGEEMVKCTTETEAMDAVFSVDDSTIYFKHPDQPKGHSAYIVLGNSGPEAIADTSVGALWDAVTEELYVYCEAMDLANN